MKRTLLANLFTCALMSARATVFHYVVVLDGPSEFPSNPSLGTVRRRPVMTMPRTPCSSKRLQRSVRQHDRLPHPRPTAIRSALRIRPGCHHHADLRGVSPWG